MTDTSQHTNEQELSTKLATRFAELPKPVQDAIMSVDVEKSLRALAEKHNLHLDKWEMLETEVMLTLYGFQPVEDLEKNIESEVGISAVIARELVEDINKIVFEPIREELERGLGHPMAKEEKTTNVERVREQVLADAAPGSQLPAASEKKQEGAPTTNYKLQTTNYPVGTPPSPKPEGEVLRGPASGSYVPGKPSIERKGVEGVVDDPYRETIQ